MDHLEQRAAEQQLARLELLLAAQERRHEVMDAVWAATDKDEATQRLRALLDVPDAVDPRVVLDMQIWRLTKEARDELAANLTHLREVIREAWRRSLVAVLRTDMPLPTMWLYRIGRRKRVRRCGSTRSVTGTQPDAVRASVTSHQ